MSDPSQAISERKNNLLIHPIPVLKDNIIWAWEVGEEAVVVDPAITEPVQEWLIAKNLILKAILQTHHHDDHIGGTLGLIKKWPDVTVIAAKSDLIRIPFQTLSVKHEDQLSLMGFPVKVLDIGGHTSNHIAYYLKSNAKGKSNPIIFCGDTLFGGGCGRIFDGTNEQMFKSLRLLMSLPPETQIYCAHEYTEANLRWANSLYPHDLLIKERLKEVTEQREKGFLSLPSSLSLELKTNLFLRAQSLEEFTNLRIHKDNFRI